MRVFGKRFKFSIFKLNKLKNKTKMFFQAKKIETATEPAATAFVITLNEYYKNFLLHYSCCVYMLASLMIICSLMYYISYWKQYLQMRRRRQALRRTNQRLARPHRPYAIYREHEVFRKIMRTVRQYQIIAGERRQAVNFGSPKEILECQTKMSTAAINYEEIN